MIFYSQKTVDFILKNESPENIARFLIHLGDYKLEPQSLWTGRLINFLTALSSAFVYFRDEESIEFDLKEFLSFMQFKKLIELSEDKRLPEEIKESICLYIETVPGYTKPTPDNPNPIIHEYTLEQHEYITMQVNEMFISEYIKK